jgi:hypothetical protein
LNELLAPVSPGLETLEKELLGEKAQAKEYCKDNKSCNDVCNVANGCSVELQRPRHNEDGDKP